MNCAVLGQQGRPYDVGTRSFALHQGSNATNAQNAEKRRAKTRQLAGRGIRRTAMSGLSARTYSWGGEGERLRGGGEGSLGGRSDTLEK